jgi:hypothetical protein
MEILSHGIPPLYNISEIEDLKGWMLSQQKYLLHDISDWNEDGTWKCWEIRRFSSSSATSSSSPGKYTKGGFPTPSEHPRTIEDGALQVIK